MTTVLIIGAVIVGLWLAYRGLNWLVNYLSDHWETG